EELRHRRAAGSAGDSLRLYQRIWRRCQPSERLCRPAAAAQTLFDRRAEGVAEKPGRQSDRGLSAPTGISATAGGFCYPCLGSSVVDHSAVSARSRKVTVICPEAPSILTWPKNCIPADGGRFCLPGPGAFMNFTSGPKLLSSSFGPNVPACNGPETN